jgi:hypothetical protein
MEKLAQRAVVPLAAAGLPVPCFAVSCQSSTRDPSGTKSNPSTNGKGAKLAAVDPVGSSRAEPSEINRPKTSQTVFKKGGIQGEIAKPWPLCLRNLPHSGD